MKSHERLELEWANYHHLNPAGMVACSSGTAALHLAFECLGLPPGSEVIVPDYTMVACPRAVVMAGLTPVFVDCGPDLLLDPKAVDDVVDEAWDGVGNSQWKEGRYLSAVLAVNVYGREYNVFGVRKATESYGVKVIEDLAESHGIPPNYNADAACWSFYKNKIVAGEEGGAVWFRDPERAVKARRMRSLGFTDAHDYIHEPRGHNYRLADCLADKVLGSLSRLNASVVLLNGTVAPAGTLGFRRILEAAYDQECPPKWRQPARDVPWVYDLRIPGMTAPVQGRIVRGLRERCIEARHGFKLMSWQEEFKNCRVVGGGNAAKAASEVIYLPLSPDLTVTRCRGAMGLVKTIWAETDLAG